MQIKNPLGPTMTKVAVATSVVLVPLVSLASISGATGTFSYDPTSALTGAATTVTTGATPILVAVTIALIPIALVFWGLSKVRRLFKARA